MRRRKFLTTAGTALAQGIFGTALDRLASARAMAEGRPDYTLRIAPLRLELAPGVAVSTIAYNGRVPGPLLRLKQGMPVSIEAINETANAELVHWHGLVTDPLNDGAMEEGSPIVPPGGRTRYRLTPSPSGSRWYHTHTMAGQDLSLATYTGQFGFLYVASGQEAGDYDREIFLAIHHWMPEWMRMGPPVDALEVSYRYASFNDRLCSAAEPLRVRRGQRVLFRFLNASATETVTLALPGHMFTVIALDGNPVPQPRGVSTLVLGVGERVDAIVEMKSPGVWVLGAVERSERRKGLGRVIEYEGSSGPPVWIDPGRADWNYLDFADRAQESAIPPTDITELPMVFAPGGTAPDGVQRWTINRKSYPETAPIGLREGARYRLVFVNGSSEAHPLHLHRHSFEIVSIAGKPCSGLIKDTVLIAPYSSMKVQFTADHPGKTLFHCHQQLHMDYGFMQLFEYA